MLTASLAKAASRPVQVADAARRAFYAASLNVRRGELVARLVAAVVRPCSRAVVRSADGPALAPSRRARVRGRSSHYNSIAAEALRCGRRRPRQPGVARGAVFESMREREGQAGALELKAALRSAVELAKLPAPAYAIEIFPTLGRTGSAARMWPQAHLAAAEIKL